jgi:hypothetical protein
MSNYQTLKVEWNEHESSGYYLNQVSCGWNKQKQVYWIKSINGTYTLNPKTKEIKLFDGVIEKIVNFKDWSII